MGSTNKPYESYLLHCSKNKITHLTFKIDIGIWVFEFQVHLVILILFTSSQELLAIQQQGPRAIGFFGTRNMGFMHQELIEILSYAMVITV